MDLLKSIDILMLQSDIKKKLKDRRIDTLGKLCKLKKKDLIKMSFAMAEIEQIEIKLQLEGLDLKR